MPNADKIEGCQQQNRNCIIQSERTLDDTEQRHTHTNEDNWKTMGEKKRKVQDTSIMNEKDE